MHSGKIFTLFIAAAVLSGCTTSSKVQEMIDASHQDYRTQLKSHDKSLNVLRQSAKASLEKSRDNAAKLDEIESRLDKILAALMSIRGDAEASKVMSAANTVKVSELETAMEANTEQDKKVAAKLREMNRLYEAVMVRHYEALAMSASEAIESLEAKGMRANTNGTATLTESIEIVAPDTTAPTNELRVESSRPPEVE